MSIIFTAVSLACYLRNSPQKQRIKQTKNLNQS